MSDTSNQIAFLFCNILEDTEDLHPDILQEAIDAMQKVIGNYQKYTPSIRFTREIMVYLHGLKKLNSQRFTTPPPKEKILNTSSEGLHDG